MTMTDSPGGGRLAVAGLQMDIAWEAPDENFDRVREMGARAVEELEESFGPGPRLLVLPEMFATGFSMASDRVEAHAEKTRAFMTGLASELDVHVLGGYAEPWDPKPANACSLISSEGEELLHYQKLHPFSLAGEHENFTKGQTVATAEVGGVRISALICYDLRFPEPFRPFAKGTDMYCVIANWPDMRRDAWSLLLRARAIENQAYVLGVNRVGKAGNLLHSGDSALIDPMGATLTESVPYEEGLVLGEVDPLEVKRVRRQLGFLEDRRPGLYGRLEEEGKGR
jgi:predicted amidohydrolase